jgi:hypothetical protein
MLELINKNKKWLKKTPLFYVFKQFNKIKRLRLTNGFNCINILKTFSLYEARGWGLYSIRAKLTIQSINQVIPALKAIGNISQNNIDFAASIQKLINIETSLSIKLGELFFYYGSDKSDPHNYHKIYANLLSSQKSVGKIFEIGLGTNNLDVVSTMGKNGKPGASLRAFKDCYLSAEIYGADFDSRILFEEERIKTFFIDQTRVETFEKISEDIGDNFDLMIDDGLHSPNANLHSLNFFIHKLKIGGYAVIEDIHKNHKEIWNTLTCLLPTDYHGALIKTNVAFVYIVKRIA